MPAKPGTRGETPGLSPARHRTPVRSHTVCHTSNVARYTSEVHSEEGHNPYGGPEAPRRSLLHCPGGQPRVHTQPLYHIEAHTHRSLGLEPEGRSQISSIVRTAPHVGAVGLRVGLPACVPQSSGRG